VRSACELRLQEAVRNAVVAVKLHVVEGGGDPIPARHAGRLEALDVRACGENNVAAAHGTADQNDLEFHGCAGGELLGAEKVNSGGADVAGHKGNWEFFGDAIHAAQLERELEGCAGILALLGVNAYGMRRDAGETPRGVASEQHGPQRGEQGGVRREWWREKRDGSRFCG